MKRLLIVAAITLPLFGATGPGTIAEDESHVPAYNGSKLLEEWACFSEEAVPKMDAVILMYATLGQKAVLAVMEERRLPCMLANYAPVNGGVIGHFKRDNGRAADLLVRRIEEVPIYTWRQVEDS